MDHNEIRYALSEYLDGSLPAADRSTVEEHLRSCPQCSDALKELQKTVEHIRGLEHVEPPAWMTQKIMAKVRSEAEHKGLFRKLFSPLHVKLPLEALGVALVAVTAFFVYHNQQPMDRFSESGSPAQKAEPPILEKRIPSAMAPELPRKDKETARPNAVPQEPEYKALDMKREYASPPPPVLQRRIPAPAAEAPAIRPEQRSDEAMKGSRQDALGSASRMQDAARDRGLSAQGAGSAENAPTAAPQAGLLYGEAGTADRSAQNKAKAAVDDGRREAEPNIIVVVAALEDASSRVERTVRDLGGAVVRKTASDRGVDLSVKVPQDRSHQLLDMLRTLGEVRDKGTKSAAEAITIRLVKAGKIETGKDNE